MRVTVLLELAQSVDRIEVYFQIVVVFIHPRGSQCVVIIHLRNAPHSHTTASLNLCNFTPFACISKQHQTVWLPRLPLRVSRPLFRGSNPRHSRIKYPPGTLPCGPLA